MAYISIAQFRSATGVDATAMNSTSVGMFLGAASAMMYSLTGRMLGHFIESMSQNGDDVDVEAYGHMLPQSGSVMVGLTGDGGLDKVHAYERINDDSLKLIGATLSGDCTTTGRLFPQYILDLPIVDSRVRPYPTPVALVEEIRIDEVFTGGIVPFDTDKIVDPENYYVAADADSLYNCEVEIAPGSHCAPIYRRVRGYINPVRQNTRRIARLQFYAGSTRSIPMDLVVAMAAIAKQVASDPLGEFQSESLDYYSYSRRSVQDLTSYPTAAMATILRYKAVV